MYNISNAATLYLPMPFSPSGLLSIDYMNDVILVSCLVSICKYLMRFAKE